MGIGRCCWLALLPVLLRQAVEFMAAKWIGLRSTICIPARPLIFRAFATFIPFMALMQAAAAAVDGCCSAGKPE